MRHAREASLFFLGFPRKKKPPHNGSYEHRVPKIKNKTFFCVIRYHPHDVIHAETERPRMKKSKRRYIS